MSDAEKAAHTANRVRFHYIKSRHFRVIHVDGAIGGVTPNGNIHMAVYSERPAIPQSAEHQVSDAGELDEGSTVGKEGIVREMDVDLMINRQTAVNIRNWLNRQIDQIDALAQASVPNEADDV